MEIKTRTLFKYLGIIALFILLVLNWGSVWNILSTLFNVAKPVIYGFITAYVINILVNIIEPLLFPKAENSFLNNIRRPLAIALSFIIIIAIIVLTFSLVIPQLISVIASLIDSLPSFINSIVEWTNNIIDSIPGVSQWITDFQIDWANITSRIVSFLESFAQDILSSTIATVSSVVSFVVNALIAFVVSIYVLSNKEKFILQFKRLTWANLNEKNYQKLFYNLSLLHSSFRNFVSGQVTEALILGVLTGVGMWIFQFPYALMIGVLTSVFALVPIIGAITSAAIAFVLIFVQSPIQAVWFLIFIVIVQQIEGNLIYPKVVGNSIGLPSLWVLVATTIGGSLIGIPGFLLGVPFASFFYVLLANNTRYKEAVKLNESEEVVLTPYQISAKNDYQKREIYYN